MCSYYYKNRNDVETMSYDSFQMHEAHITLHSPYFKSNQKMKRKLLFCVSLHECEIVEKHKKEEKMIEAAVHAILFKDIVDSRHHNIEANKERQYKLIIK